MEMPCSTCLRWWDEYTVMQDYPDGFDVDGWAIKSCPACKGIVPVDLPTQTGTLLKRIRRLGQRYADRTADDYYPALDRLLSKYQQQ